MFIFLPVLLMALPSNNGDSVNSEAPISIFERLSTQDVLEISIRTDIDRLLVNKKASDYQAAFIKFDGATDTDSEWRVDIRARGKYRNRICDFPPIKVKFNHSVLGPENLKGFKTLKLVTHCGDQAETEELLQKEYLAYKLYNIITEHSYRVQLVKINWIDSEGAHQIGEKWGFIIENEDEIAQRLGGSIYDEFGVSHDDLNSSSAALHSLYQYMIGNADWNLGGNKNISLVKPNTSRKMMIVPYDFDFSGAVDAYYAVSEFKLTSVRERVYLGESTPEEINEAKEIFKSKKKQIIDQVNSFGQMSRSGRMNVKKYILSFYSSLDEPLKSQDYYQARIASN
jgi:hypothetical protein